MTLNEIDSGVFSKSPPDFLSVLSALKQIQSLIYHFQNQLLHM